MLFSVKRKVKFENRYHRNMGTLITRVVTIKKTFLGVPYETVHKYRETYFGEVKDVSDCQLPK